MGVNPGPVIVFIILSKVVISLVTTGIATIDNEIPECESFIDIITGCDAGISYIIGFVFTVIPGLPPELALINLFIGFLANFILFIFILKYARSG